jgi:hypothetical protein
MLCITADGKLPPYIILNCKAVPKNDMFMHKNGWMTVDVKEDWVKIF